LAMFANRLIGWPLLSIVAVSLLGWLQIGVQAADEEPALREQALKLNDVTGDEPIKAAMQDLVNSPTATKKMLAVAAKMAKEKNQPFQVNATYILARTAHALREYDTSEAFYEIYDKQSDELGSVSKIAQAYVGLSGLWFEMKKYDKCEKFCREFFSFAEMVENSAKRSGMEPDQTVTRAQSPMIRRLIMSLAKQGSFDEANKLVDKLLDGNPDNYGLHDLKGYVLREDGKFEEAAKVYEKLMDKIKDDKDLTREEKRELTSEMRYMLSNVYIENKDVDKAAEQLKELLKAEPDNPTYNNDLGYIWADHDKNIEEAEKLIRKAIEEDKKLRHKNNPKIKPEDDKDNAAYLDSLGWVLYKLKKYDEAKKCFEEAVEQKEGQHVEIFDHLGDTYLALGKEAKAVEAWKKGIEAAAENKREQQRKADVEKKIKAHE
jgi:tetratricopeptide (TPR) repeat protein